MRKPALLIATNAFILIIIFVLLAQSLFLVTRIAQTQTLTGQVSMQRQGQGEWTRLQTNQPIMTGDLVRTGPKSHATFVFGDGTRWKLEENSQVALEMAVFDSLKKHEKSRLRLESGEVLVRLAKQMGPESRFEIAAPSVTVVARGAVFAVEAAGAQTLVECARGSVQLRAGSENLKVNKGQRAREIGGQVMIVGQTSATSSNDDLLRPRLETEIVKNRDLVVLRGQTEAGNTLLVNGKSVSVLGNGSFFQPLKMTGKPREIRIVARDIYGESASVCQRVSPDGDTVKVDVCQ